MRKIYLLLALVLTTVGALAQGLSEITALEQLSNSGVYVIESGRKLDTDGNPDGLDHYLLYHTDAPNNLSSTFGRGGHALEFSETKNNFQFAIYKYIDGNYYFYNIAAEKFVGNNSDNNRAIPMVDMATNAVEIRTVSTVSGYHFMLSTNGTGALNVADRDGCHGVVNWGGGYNEKDDKGNAFKIQRVESVTLSDEQQSAIAKKIVLCAARAAVAAASDVRVGLYPTSCVADLSSALDAYNSTPSDDNLTAVETAYTKYQNDDTKVANTLSAGEKFVLKCIDSNRGYLVYSTVESKGAEAEPWVAGSGYTTSQPAIDAEGVYKEWSFVTVDGKNYIFNVQKEMFVKRTSGQPVEFANDGTAFELTSGTDGVSTLKMGSAYLASAASWNGDHPVRATPLDDGARFYIEKCNESVSDDLQQKMVGLAKYGGTVEEWKAANRASLGCVGGYPESCSEAINNINSYAGIDAFVEGNEKIGFTDNGYYFIKSVPTQNYGDAYLTYGEGTNNCYAYKLGTGEKLGAKHVWMFDIPTNASDVREEGYKLKSCNMEKYLTTGTTIPGTSPFVDTKTAGYRYLFEDLGNGTFFIKDGNGNYSQK